MVQSTHMYRTELESQRLNSFNSVKYWKIAKQMWKINNIAEFQK